MAVNFDQPIDRVGSDCEKYDRRLAKFGRADVIPLWVADMDFAAPQVVQDALQKRLDHPVFGYSFASDALFEALYGWYQRRHNWTINAAKLQLMPGVVPSLFTAVAALTEPGDGVLVPTPVYPPFFAAVENNGRQLLTSPLLPTDNGYQLDFDHLEQQAANAKMLLLCSPHNPVGRVWSLAELKQLIDLALRHNLVVISDDIHADLVYPGCQHRPLATLAPPELRLLTAISPSKTFNIPGLNLSALVISHEQDRRAIKRVLRQFHVNPCNPFALAAFEAAYGHGDEWLDTLLEYLDGNRRWVKAEIEQATTIRVQLPEATCLMWLDCQALGLTDSDLRDLFVNKAGLGLNPGSSFGESGSGFMRLNIGTRRALLEQALMQLSQAL